MAIAYTRTRNPGTLALTPTQGPVSGMVVQSLYEVIDITTIAVATNTADVGYLPKGAIPIGGYFACVDLDTGTEALDMDLGFAGNGVDTADPDYFMNGGLFSGDAIATDFILTNAANYRPITGPFPVVTQFGAKTLVQLITNTAANATGTGKCCIRIDYLVPGMPTS
jgi:hypothetical protein